MKIVYSVVKTLSPVILIICLITGCSVGPEYARPDNRALVTPAYTSSSVATTESVQSIDGRWWELYEDPVLNDWVRQLITENLDLKSSAERIVQARQLVSIQASVLWPTLVLSGDSTRSFAPGFANGNERNYATNIGTGVASSWQVDLFGRARHAVESAEYGVLANIADHHALSQSLVAQLVSLRAALVLISQEIDIQRNIVKSREQTLKTVARRYRLGVKGTSAVGVYTAQENMTSARAQLAFLQQQLHETMLIVDTLLNQRPGSLQAETSGFPVLPPDQIPNIGKPAQLLDTRPDIIGSEVRVMAANAGIGVAIADLFPDLTVTASRGFSSDEVGGLLNNFNATGFIAGKVTSILLAGGRLRAQVRLRESQTRELAWQYARTVLAAMTEVETVMVQERFLRERVGQLQVSTTAARQAETLAQDRYQRGITSLLIVLDTQRRRQNAERNLLAAQRASWVARINLHLALGGNWPGGIAKRG
jgi:multidrug efflux system outer membrane protein